MKSKELWEIHETLKQVVRDLIDLDHRGTVELAVCAAHLAYKVKDLAGCFDLSEELEKELR
jgi:hypothetical protein